MTIQHEAPISGTARSGVGPAAHAVPAPREPMLDRDPEPATRPSPAQLVAGAAVLVGLALLLLSTDTAGQVWGAVLAALGLAGTIAVEWVKVARRRALQH